MNTPTLGQFKSWAHSHYGLARAVCMAQAFAGRERERIDAYILPLFKRWNFKDETGAEITHPDRLYRCHDESYCAAFYEACDVAHREHGFKGKHGHCPALRAERLLVIAENALIEAAKKLFGVEVFMLQSDERRKYLDLLLGACLKEEKAAA